MMVSEAQAELSAAEVCLRSLGYLESLSNENLTIQPYRGGSHGKFNKFASGKPYIHTSQLASDVLKTFVYSQKFLDSPVYYVKRQPNKSGKFFALNGHH